MSIFGLFITYACSWWLVLFMVLPWKVRVPSNPARGVAASAPVNPMLLKKVLVTTLLAVIPTVFFYFVVGEAKAAEPDMYSTHTSKHCVNHTPDAGVAAADGDATIGGPSRIPRRIGDTHVGIYVPAEDYTDNENPDLRRSDIYAGDVAVSPDGTARYNGEVISQQNSNAADCK